MKLKKIAEALGLVLAALAVAALCTWIAVDDSDKAEIAQSLEGAVSEESEHEEPLGIDWDSLSQEIVAWVEVPNTSISQPVAKADKQNPNAYLCLDALGQGGYGTPFFIFLPQTSHFLTVTAYPYPEPTFSTEKASLSRHVKSGSDTPFCLYGSRVASS